MNKQIAGLFDKFYSLALKEHIKDPLVHSEWVYFQSMLSSSTFERDRINMYLGILEHEKKKKQDISEFDYTAPYPEPKLEKRYSEPLRPDYFKDQDYTLKEKKQTSFEYAKSPKIMTPKNKFISNKFTSSQSKDSSYHRARQDRTDYLKLSSIATNLVKLFEAGC